MCVAVLIESKEGPTPEELWRMDDSNPHGAGVAWASGELVRYKKGLTWKQVRDMLPTLPRPTLLHFRWATHGGRARYLSHPFPLGARAVTSRKLNSAAKQVLIHNGVWTDYLKYAPRGIDTDKWSDTAIAAYAAGMLGEEILDHVSWSTAVGTASGGGRMDVTLRGDWEPHNGNMYSNLYWQRPYKAYSFSSDWRDAGNPYSESLRGYMGGWEGYTPDDRPPVRIYKSLPPVDAAGEALARSYGVQPSHSAYDDPAGDLEEIPSLTANTGEPRWRGDGKLVSLGEPMSRLPELRDGQTLTEWLDEYDAARNRGESLTASEEFEAAQMALTGVK